MTAKKAMAIQLAPEKIRVNAINPVAGETGMLHLFMGDDTLEKRSQFISTISVAIGPGLTAFTRMLSAAYTRAAFLVRAVTPPFEA